VQIVGKSHDLSNLIWLRQRGGRQMVRLWDGQEARAFAVTKEGLQPVPRNFSRMIHEGNFLGVWSGLMKVITGLAFMMLIGDGPVAVRHQADSQISEPQGAGGAGRLQQTGGISRGATPRPRPAYFCMNTSPSHWPPLRPTSGMRPVSTKPSRS
jgi:hypothetical protein